MRNTLKLESTYGNNPRIRTYPSAWNIQTTRRRWNIVTKIILPVYEVWHRCSMAA
jgi:hypothetical protein